MDSSSSNEAPKNRTLGKKRSLAALLGRKASKVALNTEELAACNSDNIPLPSSQAPTVGNCPSDSRATSEQTGRVTFAPLPRKLEEQDDISSTGPDSTRASGELGRSSHASKESAGSSTFRSKLKGLFNKKSSKNLRADANSAAAETALNEPHIPAQPFPESEYINDPILGPYRGRTLMRPVVDGAKAGSAMDPGQVQAESASSSRECPDLRSMVLTLKRMSMNSKREKQPTRLMLPSKGEISAGVHTDLQFAPTPFWDDPRTPIPLHIGKYQKASTLSTWALRNKLAYRLNSETDRLEPHWKCKHDLQLVKTVAIQQLKKTGFPHLEDHRFKVSFSSEDAWLREYKVRAVNFKTDRTFQCSFFLCLPQFPRYKLLSMASTMAYVEKHTTLPIPLIIAFNTNPDNVFGMEYFMTHKSKGRPYASVEAELSFEAKKTFARSVANCVDQLSKLAFSEIGNLYQDRSRSFGDDSSYFIGALTEPHTTRDMRVDYHLHRGPYSTMLQFYNAQIEVVRLEAKDPRQQDRLEYFFQPPNRPHPDDNIEEDYAAHERLLKKINLPSDMPLPEEDGLWEFLPTPSYTYDDHKILPTMCEALQAVLPLLVSNQELDLGATRVFHFNLSKQNLMVNEDGEIVDIIGWENAWVAPPALIQKYPPCIPDINEENPEPCLDFGSDDGDEEREDKWEDLLLAMEYEDRLRELGSAHLDVMNHQKNPKVAQIEKFLRKPPSMDAFMKFLNTIDKKEEEELSQTDSVTEG